jgi:hypothetical protein
MLLSVTAGVLIEATLLVPVVEVLNCRIALPTFDAVALTVKDTVEVVPQNSGMTQTL